MTKPSQGGDSYEPSAREPQRKIMCYRVVSIQRAPDGHQEETLPPSAAIWDGLDGPNLSGLPHLQSLEGHESEARTTRSETPGGV